MLSFPSRGKTLWTLYITNTLFEGTYKCSKCKMTSFSVSNHCFCLSRSLFFCILYLFALYIIYLHTVLGKALSRLKQFVIKHLRRRIKQNWNMKEKLENCFEWFRVAILWGNFYLFLIVPDGAPSILLQSGIVAASASVRANVVPHLHTQKDFFTSVFINMCSLKREISTVSIHPTFSFSIATKEIASPILQVRGTDFHCQ